LRAKRADIIRIRTIGIESINQGQDVYITAAALACLKNFQLPASVSSVFPFKSFNLVFVPASAVLLLLFSSVGAT
jgi:hypothetical protein